MMSRIKAACLQRSAPLIAILEAAVLCTPELNRRSKLGDAELGSLKPEYLDVLHHDWSVKYRVVKSGESDLKNDCPAPKS